MEIPKSPYQQDLDKIFVDLGVDPKLGLSKERAEKRRKIFGTNQIAKVPPPSVLGLFFRQFISPLVYLLIFVAILSAWASNLLDTFVILGVVLANACIGFFQEYKAEKAALALKQLLEESAQILSDGKREKISTRDLVPGDIVFLEAGVKIPADMRIFETRDLRVDESTLTGESTPIEKTEKTLNSDLPITEQKNMLFAGTMVISGVAKAIVCATGEKTEFGKIAESIKRIHRLPTPLEDRLTDFSSMLLKIILIGGAIILIIGIFRGYKLFEIFFVASAVIVSAIPEGLPAAITIALTIGATRILKRSSIIRKLSAIESLGSVSMIACDKTGTLTYNRMNIVEVFTPANFYKIEGEGIRPTGEIKTGNSVLKKIPNDLRKTLKIGALCNNAFLFVENKEWKGEGDPTEIALVVAAKKVGLDKEELSETYQKLDEIPFDTEYHYMATLHKDNRNKLVAVKGTIEKVLELCASYLDFEGNTQPINQDIFKKINQANERFTKNSERVVTIAYKELSLDDTILSHKDIKGLVFLGLAGMIDPPRKESFQAIGIAQKAGIKISMLTGDHPSTALAVAKELGIIENEKQAISADELNAFSDQELLGKVDNIRVFSRILPEDKLRIIEAFQKKNYVVAVTGDGVNDVPALKKADIGIAMGKGGTDLARESSELVLLDDNFGTIVSAIEEGRKVFQNIRRVVFYLISSNAGEMLVVFGGLLLGLPLPLTPLQILWINLVSDATPDIALAFEPKHKHIMEAPPHRKMEPIFNKILWTRVAIVAFVMAVGSLLVFWWGTKTGDLKYARTMLFMTMIVFQLWNVFNCRSLKFSITKLPFFSNPYIIFSILFSLALALFTIYTSLGQLLFSTVPIGFVDWAIILAVTFPILITVEIEKSIRLKTIK